MSVIDEIAAERERQVTKEGWDASHDDDHHRGEIALAAAAYAVVSVFDARERRAHADAVYGAMRGFKSIVAQLWPWEAQWFKPKDRRRDLVRAGALIVAEIERLDRQSSAKMVMAEHLTLKWGTLKAWKFESDEAKALMQRYVEIGSAAGAMQQDDTPEQKQIICNLIDVVGCDKIYLDWEGKYVSKDEAKKYVTEYGRKN